MQQILVKANGAVIPALGFGTWSLKGEDAARGVEAALKCGYRHVDTAIMYENETGVGEGLRASGVAREDVFITTKVPPGLISEKDFLPAAEGSVKRLGVSHVDLLLIHWPNPEFDLAGTIRALNKAKTSGLTKHIGVSNFPTKLLEQAWALTNEPFVTNQCEYHPLMDQTKLIAAGRKHGMSFTSYSPVGRGKLFGLAPIVAAAAKHGKTESQIILRWHVQQEGVIAIPRSSNAGRIAENIAIFDFELTAAEMSAISQLARLDGRMVKPVWAPEWDTV